MFVSQPFTSGQKQHRSMASISLVLLVVIVLASQPADNYRIKTWNARHHPKPKFTTKFLCRAFTLATTPRECQQGGTIKY